MSDINIKLYRPLRDGKEYEPLIPRSSCVVVSEGVGMTDYSVSQMAIMVREYYPQMAKVAPLLKKSTLQHTCNAIHQFGYWHFQYKLDEQYQDLRSPACSWSVRRIGIDCKSYSIVASSILTNLNITHYIRRVKQPGMFPDLWTHVYVVVPIDQITGKLDKGYYTIDSTVATVNESKYIEKSDLLMIPHRGLAGPESQPGLGLSWDEMKGTFTNIACWGGSAYTGDKLENNIKILNAFFNKLASEINTAVAQNNMAVFADKVADFEAFAGLFVLTFGKKRASKEWNSCSMQNFTATIKACRFFLDTCVPALKAWVNEYFNVDTSNPVIISAQTTEANSIEHTMNLWGTLLSELVFWAVEKFKYTKKAGAIPKFEITKYVLQAGEGNFFNSGDFIDDLKKSTESIAGTVTSTGTKAGGIVKTVGGILKPNTGLTKGGSGTIKPLTPNTPQKASFGKVAGILMAIAGVGYWGYTASQMKGSPAKPKATTTAPRKRKPSTKTKK